MPLLKFGRSRRTGPIPTGCIRSMLWLLPVLLLAACAQQGGNGPGGRTEIGAEGWRRPTHYYPPPGPPEDPWGPYIREAAERFRVPGHWVRAVMHQESGGEQQDTSSAGAMGQMQVMPATYEGLRVRYQLSDDPYDPHNSILAGTAYIREMYDRFGAPGFLAAYNAGPDRVDSYLAGRAALPDETVHYLAAITPNLGTDVPKSGPFAVYASARSGRAQRPTVASLAAGCDLNAAYDPNHPCTSLERTAAASSPAPVQQVAAESPQPAAPHLLMASATTQPVPTEKPAPPSQRPSPSAAPGGGWAIQVGAFKSPDLARAVAEGARSQAPDQLRSAALAVQPTAPFGTTVLYRARLANLSASAAANACTRLNQRQLPCVVVRPTGA